MASSGEESGIYSAELVRHGCGRWFFVVFWSLFGLLGLMTIAWDWTGMGDLMRRTGAIVAVISLCFVIYLYLKLKRTSGLHGSGIRILSNARVEVVTLRPSGFNSDPLQSFALDGQGPFLCDGNAALLDVWRLRNGDWVVGRLTIRDKEETVFAMLDLGPNQFTASGVGPNRLYIMEHGTMRPMGGETLVPQLRAVSSILKSTGSHLELTFSDTSTSGDASVMTFGTQGNLLFLLLDQVLLASNDADRQRKADQALSGGNLPVEKELLADLRAIVKEFDYTLVPKPSLV